MLRSLSLLIVLSFMLIPVARADSETAGAQLAQARGATAKYHSVEVAIADGYVDTGRCSSGEGIHYRNASLVTDGEITLDQPDLLIYEPMKNGGLRLVAVEYLVFVAQHGPQPSLFERPFDGPLVHPGVAPHWELHVWLWKHNPDGIFTQKNPDNTDVCA